MAGDWIPMRVDLHDDTAVIGIARDTGLDEDTVVGTLLRIWAWASSQTRSGLLPNVTVEWINRKVGRPGFAEAMTTHGWLSVRSGSIHIPKFERWLAKGAKARLTDAQRKRIVRKMSEECPEDVQKPLLSSPVLSSGISSEGNGGAGERGTLSEPDVTDVLLAEQWCFVLIRKKLGTPSDLPMDMVEEFRELIRLGHNPKKLLDEILAPSRDRGEFFWQFKKRITGESNHASRANGIPAVHRVGATESDRRRYDAKTKRASTGGKQSCASGAQILSPGGSDPSGLAGADQRGHLG
jgi:hypothetical protein